MTALTMEQYFDKLAVVLNQDNQSTFEAFCREHRDLTGYTMPAHPVTRALILRKMQCNTPGVRPEIVRKARNWIEERGFSTSLT